MKTYLPIIACLLATVPAYAKWQLIDDFQQWEAAMDFDDGENFGWYSVHSHGTSEKVSIREDPNENGNFGLNYMLNYAYNASYYGFAAKELPDAGIEPGEFGTIYCRFYREGPDIFWHFGTSDIPRELDDVTGAHIRPGSWQDFNALIRCDSPELELRTGSGYRSTYPAQEIDTLKWYHFWIVVDNSWDMSRSPPVCTGGYSVYIQSDDETAPRKLFIDDETVTDIAEFRHIPNDNDGNPRAIIWVMLGARLPGSPISGGDPYIIDDVYFSKGVNLSQPTKFDGFPANGSRDVDTGPFLGWINVTQAPYLWFYALNGWLYMEEPAADAPGAWGYFYK